jgi:hypothetical protein
LSINLIRNPAFQVVKINRVSKVSTKGGDKNTHVKVLKLLHGHLKFIHNLTVLVKTGHIHPHLVDTLPHWLKLIPTGWEIFLKHLKFLEKFVKGLVSNSIKVDQGLVLSLDLDSQGLNSLLPLELSVRDFLGEDGKLCLISIKLSLGVCLLGFEVQYLGLSRSYFISLRGKASFNFLDGRVLSLEGIKEVHDFICGFSYLD